MKFFGKSGVPRQEKELPAPKPAPFASRFVSTDGEPVTLEEAQKENTSTENATTATTSPTLSCSDDMNMLLLSSPLSSLLECGSLGLEQLTIEPATTTVLQTDTTQQQQQQQQETTCIDTTAVCAAFNTEALKTALLLQDNDDDNDHHASLVMAPPSNSFQQEHQARSKSLPEHALLDASLVDDSTVDFDLYRRLNKSDTDLCDGESPGALRLTKEGLKRHERKTMTFQQNGKYLSSSSKGGLSAIRLARVHSKKQTKKGGGLLQKSLDSVQNFMDYKEQVRITKMRQKEIMRQRKREAQAKRILPSKILHVDESSVARDAGIEVMNEKMLVTSAWNKAQKEENDVKPNKLTTSVEALTCIVCSSRERTHIAVPCMHFSFCEPCAKILRENQWSCPVCGIPHTTYNQVFA